jgi:hypothetical protein
MFQKLVKWVQDGNKSRASADGKPAADGTAEGANGSQQPGSKGGTPKAKTVPDAQAKLAASRCDVHPLYLLKERLVDVPSPQGPAKRMKSLCCSKEGCNRHYSAAGGYFDFVPGEPLLVNGVEGKPQCAINHEPRCMVVTKLDGAFLWACPETGCPTSSPYEDSSAPQAAPRPAQPAGEAEAPALDLHAYAAQSQQSAAGQ